MKLPTSTENTDAKTVPMTPMRRLWSRFQAFRPAIALGKRQRGTAADFAIGVTATVELSTNSLSANALVESSSDESVGFDYGGLPAVPQLNTPAKRIGRPRVAIQQSDSPFDAVVLTTLPCYPFYCHEDLIKMSRPELLETANLFNTHLPGVMQIEVSDTVSDARIRRSIETIVGIIPSTPSAPKAIRMRPLSRGYKALGLIDETYADIVSSPPTSPLAMRVTRRRMAPANVASSSAGLLERLEEVDESDFFTNKRPMKRRKVSNILFTPTFFEREDMIVDPPTDGKTIIARNSIGSPTGLSPDLGVVLTF